MREIHDKIIVGRQGFSLVEIILATGMVALLAVIFLGVLGFSQESTIRAGQRGRAIFLAEEGLEAVRAIRDENFGNLISGDYGLQVAGGKWNFVSQPDLTDIFTRTLKITDVDTHTKQINSQVQWTQTGGNKVSVFFSTILTDWRTASSTGTSTEFCTVN